MLRRFGSELGRFRPLCVLGYGIRQYDIPLLALKKQCYENGMKRSKEFWKLVDFVESAIHIDLYHLLKYKGYRKFEEATSSAEFIDLPLKRVKGIFGGSRKMKGAEIYKSWEENKERLRTYVEGDVHDTLLIAEKLAFG